ncbi:hypothetical protein ACQKP8_23385 [Photobacterium alginatilyticum]|uniref:hypothetical protein n=1 Tax=Photobacterium alginatilyticum TaxID=1775171 RepID=UPI004067CACE
MSLTRRGINSAPELALPYSRLSPTLTLSTGYKHDIPQTPVNYGAHKTFYGGGTEGSTALTAD